MPFTLCLVLQLVTTEAWKKLKTRQTDSKYIYIVGVLQNIQYDILLHTKKRRLRHLQMNLKKIRHLEMRLKQKKMLLYLRLKFYHEYMCLKLKSKDANFFKK